MGLSIRLRLSDADRERYGCDEWLGVVFGSVNAWEAALIQRGFTKDGIRVGFDSPGRWRQGLTGQVITGDDGEPILRKVETPEGMKEVPQRRPDFGAELILVWMALRRAGIDVPMAEVDYDTDGLTWQSEDDTPAAAEDEPIPGESEGKDDAGSPSEQPSHQTSPA